MKPGHAARDAAMLHAARPGPSDEARRMAFIHHHQRLVLIRQVAYALEVRNDAVHAEDPIGDDDDVPRSLGARLLQLRFQIAHVVIGVAVPLRLAQPHAIDDARVVQRIADDRILFAQQRLEHAAVGIEAGRIENGVLRSVEGSELRFEFLVDVLGAADEAHAAHAIAARIERGVSRLHHFRMRGEPQVIVRAEVEHRPPVHRDLSALLAGDDALALE